MRFPANPRSMETLSLRGCSFKPQDSRISRSNDWFGAKFWAKMSPFASFYLAQRVRKAQDREAEGRRARTSQRPAQPLQARRGPAAVHPLGLARLMEALG